MAELQSRPERALERRAGPWPERPRKANKKDTRRWCRGKLGLEHRYHWQPKSGSHWFEEVCSGCGKQRRWCGGWFRTCICGSHELKK